MPPQQLPTRQVPAGALLPQVRVGVPGRALLRVWSHVQLHLPSPACLPTRSFCLGLLESTSGNGYTPLMTACMHAHVAPARVLLANGAAVDGADPALAAPLAEACAAGKRTLSVLPAAGIEPVQCRLAWTMWLHVFGAGCVPRHHNPSSQCPPCPGCPELVELLLDNGARYPALPVKDGRASPLQASHATSCKLHELMVLRMHVIAVCV